MILTRSTLQALAEAKRDDAVLLYEQQRFSNSYYLFGYAVEIALKACISLQFSAEAIPDKSLVNRIYTHKLADLIALAGLSDKVRQARLDPARDAAWEIVQEWSEEARYDMIDPVRATAMRNSVVDRRYGVYPWITQFW